MKAVVVTKVGDQNQLIVREIPEPKCKENDVLIKIKATTVNKIDTVERNKISSEGKILGYECSGIVDCVGIKVTQFRRGEQVCAILDGGGYAEKVAVPVSLVFSKPKNVDLVRAATLPYAACSVWSGLFTGTPLSPLGFWLPEKPPNRRLSDSETLLVHEDSDGIASFAIQLANRKGAKTYVTCKTRESQAHYTKLGVTGWFSFSNFERDGLALDEGFDVILNVLGPEYFPNNVDCLKDGGRLISITDVMDYYNKLPNVIDSNLAPRILIKAPAFCNRQYQSKEVIVQEVKSHVWPLLDIPGFILPSCNTFTFDQAEQAHQLMLSGQHVEKIILVPR